MHYYPQFRLVFVKDVWNPNRSLNFGFHKSQYGRHPLWRNLVDMYWMMYPSNSHVVDIAFSVSECDYIWYEVFKEKINQNDIKGGLISVQQVFSQGGWDLDRNTKKAWRRQKKWNKPKNPSAERLQKKLMLPTVHLELVVFRINIYVGSGVGVLFSKSPDP